MWKESHIQHPPLMEVGAAWDPVIYHSPSPLLPLRGEHLRDMPGFLSAIRVWQVVTATLDEQLETTGADLRSRVDESSQNGAFLPHLANALRTVHTDTHRHSHVQYVTAGPPLRGGNPDGPTWPPWSPLMMPDMRHYPDSDSQCLEYQTQVVFLTGFATQESPPPLLIANCLSHSILDGDESQARTHRETSS